MDESWDDSSSKYEESAAPSKMDYLRVDTNSDLRPRNVLHNREGQLFYHANLATGVVTAKDAGFIPQPKSVKPPTVTPFQMFLKWYKSLPPDDRKQVDIISVFLALIFILFIGLAIWIFGAEHMCTTKECHISANRLSSSMNPAIKPCYDFYDFTCNRWEKKYPVIPGEMYSSRYQEQYAATWQYVQKLLSPANQSLNSEGMQAAITLYRSCMNTTARKHLGLDPLREELQLLGLPPDIPKEDSASGFHLSRTLALAKRRLNLDILLKFDIEPVDMAYRKMAYQFSPTLGPILETTKTPVDYIKILEERLRILKLVTKSEITANTGRSLQLAIALEDKIRKESKPYSTSNKWYTFTDLKELTSETDKLDWDEYEMILFEGYDKTMGDSGHIGQMYVDIDYFAKLTEILEDSDLSLIQQVVWWRVVERLSAFVGLEEIATVGEGEYLDINTERGHRCVLQVADVAPDPICHQMYRDNFIYRAYRDLERMMYNIHVSFDKNVNEGFLHYSVLEKMIVMEKMVSMKIQLGCPERARNESNLKELYKGVVLVEDRYLQSWKRVQSRNFDNVMERLGTFYKEKEMYHWKSWHNYNPLTIEPYYIDSANTIVIPSAAVIHHSLHGFGVKAMDYGAMAIRLATAAFKGVDRRGQYFHKNGTRVPSWFTRTTESIFRKRGRCLVDQFKQYLVNGESLTQLDASFMVDDLMAEVAGVTLGYEAYKIYRRKYEDPKLKWLSKYNTRQLLFLSFAHHLCASDPPGNVSLKYLKAEPRTYYRGRVLTAVSNVRGFSRTWKCLWGQPMIAVPRCEVL